MGTLHVCFADMAPYGVKAASPSAIATLRPTASEDKSPKGMGDATAADSNDAITPMQHGKWAVSKERTLSPSDSVSSTPQRYERNMGFFRQLSRRFGLRSQDDLVYCSGDDDLQSSSTDSSTAGAVADAVADADAGNDACDDGCAPMARPKQQAFVSSSSSSLASMRSRSVAHCVGPADAKVANGASMEQISGTSSSENSSTIDIEEHQQQHQQQQLQQDKERKSSTRSSFSRLHRRSTSSLRRAIESFTLSSRSLSCSSATPPPSVPQSQPQQLARNTCSNSGHGTPIKSALKGTSNAELHKRSTSAGSAVRTASSSSSASSSMSILSSSTAAKSKKTKPPPQRILRQPVSYTYLKGISGLPTQRVPRSSVCCQYARR